MNFNHKKFCKIIMKKKLSLTEVSEKTNVAISTISRYKNGIRNPNLKNICKLAEGLGVDIDELVD